MTGIIPLGRHHFKVVFSGVPYTKTEKKLPNYTRILFRYLCQPLTDLEFKGFVIAGRMSSGKTVLVNDIAAEVFRYYGEESVNAIMNNSGDLQALMDNMNSQPVQLLFLDDAYGKIDADVMSQFYLIRHRYEEICEEAEITDPGRIIALFGIQDYFSLQPGTRRVSVGVIAKSSTSDLKYSQFLASIFGKEPMEELDKMAQRLHLNNDQTVKNTSLIRLEGFKHTGIIESSYQENNYYRLVEQADEGDLPKFSLVHKEANEDMIVEWNIKETIQDPSFLQLIYDCVPEALEAVKTKKFRAYHADTWVKHYVGGVTLDNLKEEYGKKSPTIFTNSYEAGGWFAIFSREVIGYAAELALQQRYYPGCAVMGANNPGEPDLYDSADNLMVEVKVRKRPERPSLQMCSLRELQNIKEGNPTHLAIITYTRESCTIRIWEPLYNPNPIEADKVEENEKQCTEETGQQCPVIQSSRARSPIPEPLKEAKGIVQLAEELEKGLNPLYLPAARDLLEKTLNMAESVMQQSGGSRSKVLEMAFDHTIKETKAVEARGIYDPEATETILTLLERYKAKVIPIG